MTSSWIDSITIPDAPFSPFQKWTDWTTGLGVTDIGDGYRDLQRTLQEYRHPLFEGVGDDDQALGEMDRFR